jgi:protein SCO1/2
VAARLLRLHALPGHLDICPTTLTNITAALEDLGAAVDTLQPPLITVAPERDTPAVLKDHLVPFDPRIRT